MANILEYMLWRGDIPISVSPFNPVDNLIFATLSYLPFEHAFKGSDKPMTISQACELMLEELEREQLAEQSDDKKGKDDDASNLPVASYASTDMTVDSIWGDYEYAYEFESEVLRREDRRKKRRKKNDDDNDDDNDSADIALDISDKSGDILRLNLEKLTPHYQLAVALNGCKRFGDMVLSHYVTETDIEAEKQFAAITVDLGDGSSLIAFRGTDNTIVGWKEDFNMAYMSTVPAQTESAEYLKTIAADTRNLLRVCGHSKGGNLAVYSSAMADEAVQDRILAIYNNDGPGFLDSFFDEPGYKRIFNRIHTYIPQSSVIGMLLDHPEKHHVIYSDATSILQHDPFSWQVMATNFVRHHSITESSVLFDQTLKSWVEAMSLEERQVFVDTMFDVLASADARTIADITESWGKSAKAMITTMATLEPSRRKQVTHILGQLFSSGANVLKDEGERRFSAFRRKNDDKDDGKNDAAAPSPVSH